MRKRIVRSLGAAYARGLLSEDTLAYRLDQLLRSHLIDPRRFTGDLNLHRPTAGHKRVLGQISRAIARLAGARDVNEGTRLLALDWTGAQRELVIGRHEACDVVLGDPAVSRRHARLWFRDGSWVLQDLESTNGTTVNGTRVGRCEVRPGDRIVFGRQHLKVD